MPRHFLTCHTTPLQSCFPSYYHNCHVCFSVPKQLSEQNTHTWKLWYSQGGQHFSGTVWQVRKGRGNQKLNDNFSFTKIDSRRCPCITFSFLYSLRFDCLLHRPGGRSVRCTGLGRSALTLRSRHLFQMYKTDNVTPMPSCD
jgi:hypothetical protein